jgi:Flp pilus assembly protein TadG
VAISLRDFRNDASVQGPLAPAHKRHSLKWTMFAASANAKMRRMRGEHGGSLLEIAVMIPLLTLLLAYAVDYGYFFIVAANISTAAKNAAEYSVQGYMSAAQGTLPAAGPTTTTSTVSALALSAMTSMVQSSTTTSIQVCSKAIGTASNLTRCSAYGATGPTYTPDADPEAPKFYLNRVDITYTVQPPVPMTFFKVSLLPSMSFHRQVSMRALD